MAGVMEFFLLNPIIKAFGQHESIFSYFSVDSKGTEKDVL